MISIDRAKYVKSITPNPFNGLAIQVLLLVF